MRLAYLCNLYPAVSHSFIRREIEGVEAAGHDVSRFSIRPVPSDLKDDADLREASQTQSILFQGTGQLLFASLAILFSSPLRTLAAVGTAWRLSGCGLGQKVRHAAYLAEAAWLTRRLKALGVEHVHAHFGTNPAAVAALVHALGGPPFSFTVHGPDEFDAPLALSLPAKIDAASFVVAISSYCRSQLMRWSLPDCWGKIQIVRCGLDESFLNAETRPIKAESIEFVCVARLSAQKGLPVLIATCDLLRAEGQSFMMTIIGDGEMRSQLEADVRRRGLEDRITFAGVHSSAEIRDHLLNARAFVLPSFAEGLPVVLMEALAMGRPVITTAIAGIPELVDEQCGWLIPAGSEQALVEAMKGALAASADDLGQMGRTGRERVQRLHNAQANAERLLQLVTSTRGDGSAL